MATEAVMQAHDHIVVAQIIGAPLPSVLEILDPPLVCPLKLIEIS